MNHLQGKYIIGFVTFIVEGDSLLNFFYEARENHISLWDIKLKSKTKAEMKTYITDYKKLIQIANNLKISITLTNRNGLFVHLVTLWQKKERLIAILLSIVLLFILSNTVWKVSITGVTTQVEKEINEQLINMGIYQGAMFTSKISLDEVESKLMQSLPELLYINVKKRGTIYTIVATEKQLPLEKNKSGPSHLVAAKSGIIQKMLVKNGQIAVQVNDFVKKGDLLVSGFVNFNDEDENGQDNNKIQLNAEGKVYANTWYDVTVSSNLFTINERLEGNFINHYYLLLGNKGIPLFNFKQIHYEHIEETYRRTQLKLFDREFPIFFVKKTIFNKEIIEHIRTEDEAKQIAIDHALFDLKQKLGKDADIVKYYILHEVKDNGKVKLRLYVSALENIAQPMPINQNK